MNIEKQKYNTPTIELVELDNEISLTLESAPPEGPDEGNNNIVPSYFNNDPFKTMNA